MLDREWVELILQAKSLGLTVEEVKVFLDSREIPQKRNEEVEESTITETPIFYTQLQ